MKPLATVLLATTLTSLLLPTAQGQPSPARPAPLLEQTVLGQVVVPSGDGRRGLELRVTIQEGESTPQETWLQLEPDGRFSHTFHGQLTAVLVTAGSSAEVYRIDASAISEANATGEVDLGVIDLRDRLKHHRLTVHASEGSAMGNVRVAMWPGPPPVGPWGEPVSLGSRQFPPVALGSDMDWLVPNDAQTIYFLVERPDGPGRGRAWRSGRQRLFGPYTSETLPAELMVD